MIYSWQRKYASFIDLYSDITSIIMCAGSGLIVAHTSLFGVLQYADVKKLARSSHRGKFEILYPKPEDGKSRLMQNYLLEL